jgi:hypothetical protein
MMSICIVFMTQLPVHSPRLIQLISNNITLSSLIQFSMAPETEGRKV